MGNEAFNSWSFGSLIQGGILEIGDGYRAKNVELGGNGPIFLRAGHVTDTHIDFEGVERFHDELTEKLNAKMSKPGDTIITTKGNSTGRASFVIESMPPFVYSPHLSYWRSTDPEQLANGFLRYWARSPEFGRQLAAMKASTDMAPYLSLTDQRRLIISLPAPDEQQAIGCILGALDDKIELNRRRNRTLEAMARTIFQSWFVDFGPVRAKAEGREPPGMSKEIAALFPDSFEDSALGPIPAGWLVHPLPDLFEVNPRRTLEKGSPAPYLDMANMPTQGPAPESWIMREPGSGMKFINGDTLFARITPCLENGKIALIDFLGEKQVGWGSTEYIVLRPKQPIPPVFAYLLASSVSFRSFAVQQMNGSSGRQRVPANSLGKYKLASPEYESMLFVRFGEIVSPMFSQITLTVRQSHILAALRDTLLPKLISGELRVPDAERIVGRAT